MTIRRFRAGVPTLDDSSVTFLDPSHRSLSASRYWSQAAIRALRFVAWSIAATARADAPVASMISSPSGRFPLGGVGR